MILTRDELDKDWFAMFQHCRGPESAKAEVLALFSDEPDDEHEWSEQDIYEQMRIIVRKYE